MEGNIHLHLHFHDQKDGSEFSDVTLASEDDNDNSDLNEC